MRYKVTISYDGSQFYGFQKQSDKRSVQEEIEKALSKLTKETISIHASGRTDAKVHAYGQVFHFDTSKAYPINRWKEGMNHFFPEDIYCKEVELVDETFHARYSAKHKEYHYYLSTNSYNPFQRNYIYQYPYGTLDIKLMQEAANLYIGTHNFASFCVYEEKDDTIKTIESIIIEENNGIYLFKIKGNGFKRYMVRLLVGLLIQIGAKRKDKQFLLELLHSEGKKKCLFKAKPEGLYLFKVSYE